MYHDEVFSSVQPFLEAINDTLIRHFEQADPEVDHFWPQRQHKLYDLDLYHLPCPRSVHFLDYNTELIVGDSISGGRNGLSWL